MRRISSIAVLIIALVIGAVLPCLALDHAKPVVGPFGPPLAISALGKAAIGIELQTIEKKSRPAELSVPGKIDVIATRRFDQHAPLSGRISSVNIVSGQMVKQGQILAVIESPEMNELAAQLLQNRMEIESELAKQTAALNEEVTQAKEHFTLAQDNFQRMTKLAESKIAARKDVMAAETEYQLATARLNTATANRSITLKTLKNRLDLTLAPIRQRLEMLGVNDQEIEQMMKEQRTMKQVPVYAARSGFVTSILASAGMSIDPSVSLFTISDLSKVWATAQIYEDEMDRMRIGQLVHVKVNAIRGRDFDGRIMFIGNQVDPATRTLPVRVELDNSSYVLKPDMYAELIIETADFAPIIAIPRDAIVQQGGSNVVFVEVNSGYQPVKVQLGRSIGGLSEVTAGLQVGNRIVTRGAFQLGAELIKNSGGAGLFDQATEGDHDHDHDHAQTGGINLSTQNIVLIILAAFVFGFAISAVILFKGKSISIVLDEQKKDASAEAQSTGKSTKGDHV